MNILGFVATMAVFVMLGSGCARTQIPPPQDQSLTRSVTTLDDQFVRIAEQMPGFGGMFFDEHGVLNVYIKAVAEPPNASALRELHVRVITVITDVMGKNFFAQARGPRGGPAKQTLPTQTEEIKILKGEFDVLQLVAWRKSLDQVLSVPGVVFTDLDEQQNRLKVGIEASTARQAIEAQLTNLGIPQEALIIEVTQPVRLQATLRDKRRPVPGGMQIEADVGVLGGSKICTLGFNAVRGGGNGFVTNSHCTTDRGSSNDTDFHQPDDPLFSSNKIGAENADPPFFTGGACPAGQLCRYSDSVFIDYTVSRGRDIARTTNDNGSITIDAAHPTIPIVSETVYPTVGIVLNKMGRTTGWTFGSVTNTCADVPIAGNITMLCQGIVNRITGNNKISDNGDSGSPVFGLLSDDREASLYGILWGGVDNGSLFYFSSMILIEHELGPLTTIFPPSTNPPGCPSGWYCCVDIEDGQCPGDCAPVGQKCP